MLYVFRFFCANYSELNVQKTAATWFFYLYQESALAKSSMPGYMYNAVSLIFNTALLIWLPISDHTLYAEEFLFKL